MQGLFTNKTIEKLKYDLVRDNLISFDHLSEAEEISKSSGINLAQVLIQHNLLSEESLLSFIEAKLHIPYVNLDDYTLDKKYLECISPEDAKKYKIIPLFKIEDILTIAMADPLDLFALNNLIDSVNCHIEPIICSERSILQAIENNYSSSSIDVTSDDAVKFDWRDVLNSEESDDIQSERIIEAIIKQALQENIHEIFLEHVPTGLAVKFKTPDEISEKGNIPILLVPSYISKLKSISGLNLLSSEIPQLGKLKLIINSDNISVSVSSFPTIRGERITLKIYKPPKSINELPLKAEQLELIKSALNSSGIILVCGPDLSGKTSVIYSLLSSLDYKNKNIITVESIAKYDLPLINQCEFNENVGFNYDKALRHIEYQSPDVIYFESAFSEENIEFIISLARSGKLLLVEIPANNLNIVDKWINNSGFSYIKDYLSCTLFVHNENNIEIKT